MKQCKQIWLLLSMLLLFIVAGCAQATSTSSGAPNSNGQTATQSTTSQSSSLQKPGIPSTGAYIGTWVNPAGTKKSKQSNQEPGTKEITQLPAFNQAIGTHVQILHLYTAFTKPLPVQTMNAIEQNGSIPMVDWACGDVSKISSGADDTLITTYAQAMKSFGKPVFLHWY